MKSLKLKALQIGATEFLSRDQMKNVLGGADGPCFFNGDSCNDNVQCCSTCCFADGGGSTGKTCYAIEMCG